MEQTPVLSVQNLNVKFLKLSKREILIAADMNHTRQCWKK